MTRDVVEGTEILITGDTSEQRHEIGRYVTVVDIDSWDDENPWYCSDGRGIFQEHLAWLGPRDGTPVKASKDRLGTVELTDEVRL
mgnify:CR=1 FL=1